MSKGRRYKNHARLRQYLNLKNYITNENNRTTGYQKVFSGWKPSC